MKTFTAYVKPSDYSRLHLVAIPHEMREGQSPRDLREEYQELWVDMGIFTANYVERKLDLTVLFYPFAAYRGEVEDLTAGSFVEIPVMDFEFEHAFGPNIQDRMKEITARVARRNRFGVPT